MKEITILSGKGGTGKTSVSAALASVANNAVFCDNDVDAADLHLILNPKIEERHTFKSGWIVIINNNDCNNCGVCNDICRFNAINISRGIYNINKFQCEGCRLCERECPSSAISSKINDNNSWFISDTRFGKLVHAKMGAGEENSGRLVSKIRDAAKQLAVKNKTEYIINDGPPGIGCAAISSVTGTNTVLLVIEPTKSGLHDIRRLVELVKSFNIEMYAVINKFDINIDITHKIEEYLLCSDIPLVGKLPFDTNMVDAIVSNKTIIEYSPGSEISNLIIKVWDSIK